MSPWPAVVGGCWLSLLAVGIWVARWFMRRDAKVAALEAANAELQKQLRASNAQPTVSASVGRMAFLPGLK